MDNSFPIPIGLFIALELIFIVPTFAGMWKTFQKAGKPGWACIVPIYNMIVLVEIAEKPMWWVAMMFVPFANVIFMIMAYNEVAKKFGKEAGFTVGLIFLPFIFWPILGFGDSVYMGQGLTNNELLDR
jgi:hypothetical protein